MFLRALFDPLSLFVLAAVLAALSVAGLWFRQAQREKDRLSGGLDVLRRVGSALPPEHPIRRRLESAPVVELSFEEIARLMRGDEVEPAARTLVRLEARTGWIERFAQLSIHLGILGTVFALVNSDPTNLESFRSRLPIALGTTFWGLIGAVGLSIIAGACETLLDRASQHVREALLQGLEERSSEGRGPQGA